MAITAQEIKRRLAPFCARWSLYDRSERAEAQTFLNELLECYGTRRSEVATFEEPQAGRFLDLIWPGTCIIEMKSPREAGQLARHREQALDYWRNSADVSTGVRAPRFVVISAFRRMEIWEPGAFPSEPRIVLDLIELPERYDALLFLAGRDPIFTGHEEDITREAVAQISELYLSLGDRVAAGPDVLRDFVLQCVWCMFAEDLGLIDEHGFTRLVDDLRADPSRSSADDLGQLFAVLNDPGVQRPSAGRYRNVPYADGGLFAEPARVHLEPDELDLLRAACVFDWRKVQPAIFGSLLEGCLGHDKQWALGAQPMRPTSRRSSSRRSSGPGRSGSPRWARTPRPSRRRTTCSTTWCSTPPAARETSSTSPTASSGASRRGCGSARPSCDGRRASPRRRR